MILDKKQENILSKTKTLYYFETLEEYFSFNATSLINDVKVQGGYEKKPWEKEKPEEKPMRDAMSSANMVVKEYKEYVLCMDNS